MVALETNRDHPVLSEITSKCCIPDSFVDYYGYSISSKGFLPTVVDILLYYGFSFSEILLCHAHLLFHLILLSSVSLFLFFLFCFKCLSNFHSISFLFQYFPLYMFISQFVERGWILYSF